MKSLLVVALPAALAGLTPLGAAAVEPWDAPAFSVPATDLVAAAQQHTPVSQDPSDVLLYEVLFSLDDQNRWTERRRLIYRVVDEEELDNWAVLESQYSPWYQAKPELRARVISPAGEERWLDRATIEEAPAEDSSVTVFTDSLRVRAPLPGVVVGSVVETEVVQQETQPFFAAGEVQREYFWLERAVALRIVVDTPESTPVLYQARLFPQNEPRLEREAGRLRRVLELRNLDLETRFEVLAPPDVAVYPEVAFTTGESWGEVASQYSRLVEEALSGANFEAWVRTARKGARDEQAVLERLVARLHAEVRYTGVEFDEASIVPRSPAETLERGFGDCKDKATLLVGLLRAAGIPAEVALLRASMNLDIDPALPGMGQFNHAIVHLPGSQPRWIDPTVPEARVGVLPTADAGRLALIASPSTTELVTTPTSSSAENRLEISREVFLADYGKGRLVEETRSSGVMELWMRSSISDGDENSKREWARSRAENLFLTTEVEGIEISPTKDLSAPFRTVFTAKQSGRGFTDLHEAAVGLRLDELLGDVPHPLQEDSEAIREHDLVVAMPHTIEWTYVIHPPPGFQPREVPPNRERALGSTVLAESYEALPNGGMKARMRFDTGKRRLTPSEVVETRRALRGLLEDPAVLLYFDQVGYRLLGEGKVPEAAAELRALVDRYPEKGIYHLHLARAYLNAGLGGAARSEARQATRLSPVFAPAWSMQAWVLQHDELGRRFGKGWSREGVIAAYRKAIELDSSRTVDLADLAIVLEYSGEGVHFASADADLAEAETLYRKIRKDGEVTALDTNLMINLARRGRFEELKAFAAPLGTLTSKAYHATALAVLGQTDAALALARGVTDASQRAEVLSTVSQNLVQLRRYAEAAHFVRQAALAAGQGTEALDRAGVLERVKRFEELTIDPSRPDAPFWSLMRLLMDSEIKAETLLDFVPAKSRGYVESELAELEAGREVLIGKNLSKTGLDAKVVLDFTLGAIESSFDGNDDTGHRVRLSVGALAGKFAALPDGSLYVTKEDGTYRLVCGYGERDDMADWILDLIDKGSLEAARQWLDWAREEIELASGEDPFQQRAFPLLWRRGSAAEPSAMKVAAAALAFEAEVRPLKARSEATKARKREIHQRCRFVLEEAARSGFAGNVLGLRIASLEAERQLDRWAELAALAGSLLAEEPESERLREDLAWGLARSGKVQQGRESLASWTATGASLDVRERLQTFFELAFGDLPTVEPLLRVQVEKNRTSLWPHSALAWTLLLRGETSEVVELARKGVKGTEKNRTGDLHTLAAALAETGAVVEAQRVFLQSLEHADLEEPDSDHAYILGRIAEAYGLPEVACDFYRQVEPAGEAGNPNRATRVLAERRLAALEKPPAKVKKRGP